MVFSALGIAAEILLWRVCEPQKIAAESPPPQGNAQIEFIEK
jgi:choline-glycine betaine transporter